MRTGNFFPQQFSQPLLSTFILNGIPGLEAAHIWISIPFFMFYIISLLGNCMVLFVVNKEKTLHKPMYLLLCMLALTDIGVSSCIVPKTLDITVDGCLTQMFFFHAVASVHSAILVTMAFDRYVAISHPLRYTTILTNARITKLGLLGLIRAVLLALPGTLVMRRLHHPAYMIQRSIVCDILGKFSMFNHLTKCNFLPQKHMQ
uniref:G-protein coupled receptors family 1 profile domain-containing protein n=1 Tax=Pelusios castaneus TaxID=367368 RepID=A0A8C8RYP7_9SAUR